MATDNDLPLPRRRVLIVGAGSFFLSGISYYTHRLAMALNVHSTVAVLLLRRLIPVRLYPGRQRVGQRLASFRYPQEMPVLDGVDWWGRGLAGGIRFMRRQRPDAVVFQWWTGAVLHSYLVLALAARILGAKVVVEFHESQDVGEMKFGPARVYVDRLFPLLLRMAGGLVVHNQHDLELIGARHDIAGKEVAVITHGPYDTVAVPDREVLQRRPAGVREILWFGVVRPFKGVEDLVAAFDKLTDDEVADLHLTLVGETWEGWTVPFEAAAKSRHASRITIVDRYVTDEELAAYLARAYVVALPYHRSSSSGPLSMAMAHGLPVIVSRVGGLVEAARDFDGAFFVPPHDVEALTRSIRDVCARPSVEFAASTSSWKATAAALEDLFDRLLP